MVHQTTLAHGLQRVLLAERRAACAARHRGAPATRRRARILRPILREAPCCA